MLKKLGNKNKKIRRSSTLSANRRYSYSPTALGRETSQHDCEAKAGNFLAKTQTDKHWLVAAE